MHESSLFISKPVVNLRSGLEIRRKKTSASVTSPAWTREIWAGSKFILLLMPARFLLCWTVMTDAEALLLSPSTQAFLGFNNFWWRLKPKEKCRVDQEMIEERPTVNLRTRSRRHSLILIWDQRSPFGSGQHFPFSSFEIEEKEPWKCCRESSRRDVVHTSIS